MEKLILAEIAQVVPACRQAGSAGLKMKYYIYVLQSLKDGKLYTGFSKDPYRRIKDHNKGSAKSTKGRRPFKILHIEECKNREDARNKEKLFKSGYIRELLKEKFNSCRDSSGSRARA